MSSFWKKLANEAGNILLNNISENVKGKNDIIDNVVDNAKEYVVDKNIIESSEYTQIDILGAKVRFKSATPTLYWNSNENYGAGEIDTVFIYSETGTQPIDFSKTFEPGYTISGITFATNSLNPSNQADTKQKLNRIYGLTDVDITKADNSMFMYKVKSENDKYYFESNYMEYEGSFEGEDFTVYYEIYLLLDKNNISSSQLYTAIGEYHLMIKTMEFIK